MGLVVVDVIGLVTFRDGVVVVYHQLSMVTCGVQVVAIGTDLDPHALSGSDASQIVVVHHLVAIALRPLEAHTKTAYICLTDVGDLCPYCIAVPYPELSDLNIDRLHFQNGQVGSWQGRRAGTGRRVVGTSAQRD